MKRALITGALGQDGSYLSEYLLSLGYEVWGIVRRLTTEEWPHDHHVKGVHYEYGDMRDAVSLETVIRECHPDEIYNLAGQVFVPTSWRYPAETLDVNTGGLARILDIVLNVCKNAKVYQASSSEMFGNIIMKPRSLGPSTGVSHTAYLSETSPMHPVSPYAVSKLASHRLIDVYRNRGVYAVSGILFNHESPRRGTEMVTRKITRWVAKCFVGEPETLELGNIHTKRDWGFAGDYVEAMHLMLQQPYPDDFVIGTGESRSVEEFLNAAIQCSGLDMVDAWRHVSSNTTEFNRENELHVLAADASKAKKILGWHQKHYFKDLVRLMVDKDIEKMKRMCHV